MTRHLSGLPSPRVVLFGLLAGCGALAPATVSTLAADTTVASTWRTADVAADGSIADWSRLDRVTDGPAVAAQNDGSALYLAIASNDPTIREQLATGLIVWVDGTGRKRQTFGVRLEGLVRRTLPGAAPDASAAGRLAQDRVLNPMYEFDLLGPARQQRRLIDNPGELGLAAASGVEDGTIVYEVKLPFEQTGSTPHAVNAKAGATIAVGLETPKDPKPPRQSNRLDNPMNTNPWVVNPYGGYFDPPPPPGGYPTPPREVVIKPMELLWVIVRTASSANAATP